MLGLPELIILGFASYRATQLVVYDTIGDSARRRIELWHASDHTSRFRTFIRQLISCPYCCGWWLSLLTALAYLTATSGWGRAPLLVHAVECWAVMGVQALLNRWDDSSSGPAQKGN